MPSFPIEEYLAAYPRPVIHFIGIGGVSMSAIAELLYIKGFRVSGNDRDESDNTSHLRDIGIDIKIGHDPEYVHGSDIIIRNAAIKDSSPDMAEAYRLGIPVFERPDVLGALMRSSESCFCISGTHGKSTTTAMCSKIAVDAGIDPTIFCGAKLPDTGIAYRFGSEKLFIAEACEYCDSFLSFFPTHAVILNIEPDHLDYFSGIDQIRTSFRKFASMVPSGGLVAANGDDPEIRKLLSGINRNIRWFGFDSSNDYYPADLTENGGYYSFTVMHGSSPVCGISLSVPGMHNAADALAAAALCDSYGISREVIGSSLSAFGGAKRRFQNIGSYNGAPVIDDFAHHPTELAAVLRTAKTLGFDRVVCIFQPHTYSRTIALKDDFISALSIADVPLLAPIYSAREINEHNISSHLIGDEISGCHVFDSFDEILPYVKNVICKGDIVLTVGAGDIFKIGRELASAGE